jgi:hypothetical protein
MDKPPRKRRKKASIRSNRSGRLPPPRRSRQQSQQSAPLYWGLPLSVECFNGDRSQATIERSNLLISRAERALSGWARGCQKQGLLLSKEMIREKARYLIPTVGASNSELAVWLDDLNPDDYVISANTFSMQTQESYWMQSSVPATSDSSINSSLRDDDRFDPREQNLSPSVAKDPRKTQSPMAETDASQWPLFTEEHRKRKRTKLPPAPPGSYRDQCKCYICNTTVKVQRRRDWRRHVMEDLKPYMCIANNCTSPHAVYSRRDDLNSHMITDHPELCRFAITRDFCCPFCQRRKYSFPGITTIKHMGSHMEEIAFAVVTRAYEDWSYAETSSRASVDAPNCLFGPLKISSVDSPLLGLRWAQFI